MIQDEVAALEQWLDEHVEQWVQGCRLVCLKPMSLSLRFRVAVEDKAVEVLKKVSNEAERVVQELSLFRALEEPQVVLEDGAFAKLRFRFTMANPPRTAC